MKNWFVRLIFLFSTPLIQACYYNASITDLEPYPKDISINPRSATTSPGYPITFFGKGGTAPYSYSIITGPGTINPNTGVYISDGITRGFTTVAVRDSNGFISTASIYNHSLSVDGQIDVIAKNGNDVFLGGLFSQVTTGFVAPKIVNIDLDTGMPQTFCNFQEGFNSIANAVVSSGSSIYVGGNFTTYRGESVGYLVKLNSNCELDKSFTQIGNGFDNAVLTLALNKFNNSIYVGGQFTQYRGVANNAQFLAKLDLTTGDLDNSFTQTSNGFDNSISSIAINENTNSIYVGGQFTQYRGVANNAQYLAKLDLTSGS